jgi:eukaryotic-like serine/threonine-protein kinase
MSEPGDDDHTMTSDRTMTATPDVRQDILDSPLRLPERYRDLGRIARGGFGEIRRVHDAEMERVVAMKLLRADIAGAARIQARFVAEAKLTGGLEHPGIVSVHDRGQLEDGRLWFTMREVRGRTLGDVIDEVHDAAGPEGFRETASGWTFRRLVDAFARVCQAVAFAHRRGVVHRDLKPDNIMVGEFGEALVMDWGLGRRVGGPRDPEAHADEPSEDLASPALTQVGDVLGTPVYMPPEQALGQRDRHAPPSDVYALGAVLYHLLSGQLPYDGGSALTVLRQVVAGPPRPVTEAAEGKPVPAELAAICEKAMAREMSARYPDAEALAREVVAWLDGARRKEQALAVVDEARAMEPEIKALRAKAGEVEARARAIQSDLRPYDPIEKKRPAWELEDEAKRLGREAALAEARWMQAVQGALSVDPDLAEAHAMLADHHRAQLVDAERAHREEDAARAEAMLRAHDRGRHAAFLQGDGALTLVTDPPGAEVRVERYVLEDRRLVPVYEGVSGRTPIVKMPLKRGSYLLRIRAPGRAEVRVPVLIERDGHWDGVAPGESEPYPIVLPKEGELGAEECYVPAGWCWIGGDPEAPDSLPRKQVWIDGFVMHGSQVTTAAYLAVLNDLVTNGREGEALAASPRLPGGDERALQRGAGGVFELPPDREGLRWRPDWPMPLVDWYAASAYMRWLADRTRLSWRLPNELEREKAARGADARLMPWGDHLDATFACVLESHRGSPEPATVGAYPKDESPYGIRGLAGQGRDWCINVWKPEGPDVEDGRLLLDQAAHEDDDFRIVRGGSWGTTINNSRVAARFGARPRTSWHIVGMRGARAFRAGA